MSAGMTAFQDIALRLSHTRAAIRGQGVDFFERGGQILFPVYSAATGNPTADAEFGFTPRDEPRRLLVSTRVDTTQHDVSGAYIQRLFIDGLAEAKRILHGPNLSDMRNPWLRGIAETTIASLLSTVTVDFGQGEVIVTPEDLHLARLGGFTVHITTAIPPGKMGLVASRHQAAINPVDAPTVMGDRRFAPLVNPTAPVESAQPAGVVRSTPQFSMGVARRGLAELAGTRQAPERAPQYVDLCVDDLEGKTILTLSSIPPGKMHIEGDRAYLSRNDMDTIRRDPRYRAGLTARQLLDLDRAPAPQLPERTEPPVTGGVTPRFRPGVIRPRPGRVSPGRISGMSINQIFLDEVNGIAYDPGNPQRTVGFGDPQSRERISENPVADEPLDLTKRHIRRKKK